MFFASKLNSLQRIQKTSLWTSHAQNCVWKHHWSRCFLGKVMVVSSVGKKYFGRPNRNTIFITFCKEQPYTFNSNCFSKRVDHWNQCNWMVTEIDDILILVNHSTILHPMHGRDCFRSRGVKMYSKIGRWRTRGWRTSRLETQERASLN